MNSSGRVLLLLKMEVVFYQKQVLILRKQLMQILGQWINSLHSSVLTQLQCKDLVGDGWPSIKLQVILNSELLQTRIDFVIRELT